MQSKLETGITRPILQDSDHVADERAGRLEGSAYPAESPTVGVLPLRRKTLSILAAADLVAFILSFSIVLVIKYEQPLSRFLQPPLVVGLPMVWAFSTILTRKLSKLTSRSFIQNVRGFSLSFFIMLGGISLLLELFPYIIPSRFAIVGSLLLGYVLEIILLQSAGPSLNLTAKSVKLVKTPLLFAADLALLLCTLITYMLILFIVSKGGAEILLLVGSILLGWFASSILSHRSDPDFTQNYWKFIYPFTKEYFVFGCICSFLAIIFRLHGSSIHLLAGGVVAYAGMSFIAFSSIFFARIPQKKDDSRIPFLKDKDVSDELVDTAKLSRVSICRPIYPEDKNITLREALKIIHLVKFPGLFSMIDQKVDLNGLNIKYSIVTRTNDLYDVEVLPNDRLQLFLNLCDLNRMRRINLYLIEVNKKLAQNGLFIGRFEPNKNRYNRFLRKYPFYFAQLFYARDFIWHRVFPKLAVCRGIYFAISKGRNRALSIAEALGRLYFCGFDLASAFELDGYIYFIALKKHLPPSNRAPLYGPLFRLKRVGQDGKNIFVYKLRTMHPYSEYIQEFVYETNNLEVGGKLRNDFRVTSWGRVLRRLWIDELPMLINFLNGDLKLVGVRPLSNHYLSLYEENLRLRRTKYKPGLIPPFYVDMPKTLKEIMVSEKKYLDEFDKNPVATDMKYFLKAAQNIVLRGARSA